MCRTHTRAILISGNSKDGAIFAGKHGFDLGFSYMAPEKCAVHADVYRETARANGWEPTADNIQYRHFMYVAPTDADVAEARPAFEGKGLLSIFAGATPDTMLTMMQIGAAMGGVPKHVKIEPGDGATDGAGTGVLRLTRHRERPDRRGSSRARDGATRDLVGGVNPLAHDTMLATPEADRRRGRPRRAQRGMVSGMVTEMVTDTASDDRGDPPSARRSVAHTVAAAGFDVTYYEAGEGEPLLCLPGAGGPHMRIALDLLAHEYRVVVLELPGWGAQPNDVADFDGLAEQVALIATAIGLDTFHLMGTSLGGACALHLATLYPERVRSMVLEAPAKFREASVSPTELAPDAVRQGVPHPSRADPAHGAARPGVPRPRVADGRALGGRRCVRRSVRGPARGLTDPHVGVVRS